MRGEVILLIDALLPEVLIRRARETGVVFRWIESAPPHGLLAGVSAADARRLQALCARYGIPLRVLSRRGRYALMTWLRRRWTLAASVIAFCLVCWLCLAHIWQVDVAFTGPSMEMGDPAQVRQALKELGIRPGMGRDIDPAPLSDALAARLKGMSFVGVKLEGVRLRVEAALEVPAPRVYDADADTDLTACRGGIVTEVTVEAGEPRVKPGDTVLPGQLLIRGEERDTPDTMRPVAARGEVTIRTWFEGSAEGSLTAGEVRRTGRCAVSAELVAPWDSWPLKEAEDFAQQESYSIEVEDTWRCKDWPAGLRRVVEKNARDPWEKQDEKRLICTPNNVSYNVPECCVKTRKLIRAYTADVRQFYSDEEMEVE